MDPFNYSDLYSFIVQHRALFNVQFYKGPKGEERVVRVQDPKGAVYYYEGPKGKERLWARRNGVAVTGSF